MGMKVLASTLLFSLAGSAYGQITPTGFPTTAAPTTGFPTTETPNTVFPTTAFPTTAFPTTAVPCVDSTREFVYKEDQLKDCAWVSKNPEVRCAKENNSVATHCPATCGTCDTCNDAVKQFMTLEKGLHTCEWVGAKGNLGPVPQRCKDIGDDSTCRKTCGTCATTGAPKCMDSTQKFYVNGIARKCGWVAGAPETKCLKGKVASHCPVTCGTCDDGCKDSGALFEVAGLTEAGESNNFRYCKWVNSKSTNIRCGMIDAFGGETTCPKSCGFC